MKVLLYVTLGFLTLAVLALVAGAWAIAKEEMLAFTLGFLAFGLLALVALAWAMAKGETQYDH